MRVTDLSCLRSCPEGTSWRRAFSLGAIAIVVLLVAAGCGGTPRSVEDEINTSVLGEAVNVRIDDCQLLREGENEGTLYRCRYHSPDNFVNEPRCFWVRDDDIEPVRVGTPPRFGCPPSSEQQTDSS